jgi:hypothetical protein
MVGDVLIVVALELTNYEWVTMDVPAMNLVKFAGILSLLQLLDIRR